VYETYQNHVLCSRMKSKDHGVVANSHSFESGSDRVVRLILDEGVALSPTQTSFSTARKRQHRAFSAARMWKFEDALLSSSRVIYISETKVQWECAGLKASNTFPRGLPSLIWESVHYRHDDQGFRFRIRSFMSSGAPFTEREIVHYDIWSSIVTAYSRKPSLQRPTKLAGLAGPAIEMEKIVKDEYLLGHWKRTISWSLLWHSKGSQNNACKKHGSSIPSWSWVGWNGSVEIPKYFPGRCLVDLVSMDSQISSTHSKVQPSKTILCLRGRLSMIHLMEDSRSHELQPQILLKNKTAVPVICHHDCVLEKTKEYYALWMRLTSSSHLESSQFSISALILVYDEQADWFVRSGVLTIASGDKETNQQFDWSEKDLEYASDGAQIINIR
jgi:hypothetical protein